MSKWQLPLEMIPEMPLHDFAQVMKESFAVLSEPVVGRAYAIRMIGSPYNSFVSECRSIEVMAHHRGGTQPPLISPHNIMAVLRKFQISDREFLDALGGKGPPEPPLEVPKEAKPN